MTDGDKPRLIVVAGPNGSGKTSITQQLLMHEWMGGCVYVNPDFIARDEFGDWNAPDAVVQAAQHAAAIRENCLASRRSLAFETVLSAPDKLDFICRARKAGFFVRLFFLGTDDPSINAKRVAMRVMKVETMFRFQRSLPATQGLWPTALLSLVSPTGPTCTTTRSMMPAPACCFVRRKVGLSRPTV